MKKLALVLVALANVGCQLQPPPKNLELPLAEGEGSAKSPVAASLFQTPSKRIVRFAFGASVAMEMESPPCQEADRRRVKLALILPLSSHVGEHRAVLALTATPAGELVNAAIEERHLTFASGGSLIDGLFERGCAALKQAEASPEVALDAKEHAIVKQWAEQIAPDCRIDAAPRGFFCNLPDVDPAEAERELVGVRTAMIRSWSRQPYLISRRVAVGIALAQALQRDSDKELDKFCNVVRHSLKKELPATLASSRWLAAACSAGSSSRRLTASFGLAKTLVEIDMIRQLYERTSKLGSLAVRIPDDAAPAKNFLVSLTPAADVTEALAREAVKLVADDSTAVAGAPTLGLTGVALAASGVPSAAATSGTARLGGTTDHTSAAPAGGVLASAGATSSATPALSFYDGLAGACWHPVFGEDPRLMQLARTLAMAGPALQVGCEAGRTEENLALSAAAYFAESLTSETEFVVGNGRATTLRLPVGSYSYVLRALPDDAEMWDDAAQADSGSKGSIIWDARRPRPVIATW